MTAKWNSVLADSSDKECPPSERGVLSLDAAAPLLNKETIKLVSVRLSAR